MKLDPEQLRSAMADLHERQRNAIFAPGTAVVIRGSGKVVMVVTQTGREVNVRPPGGGQWTYLAEHLRPRTENVCRI